MKSTYTENGWLLIILGFVPTIVWWGDNSPGYGGYLILLGYVAILLGSTFLLQRTTWYLRLLGLLVVAFVVGGIFILSAASSIR